MSLPEIDNNYIGTVYGNILDQYDSPTYNIRLYMVRESVARNLTPETINQSSDEIADKKDIIVLCQTGVTSATVDSLEITTLNNPSEPRPLMIRFSIDQPGQADFVDQIQLTKKYLGYPNGATALFFLDVRFLGYTSDPSDNDSGGTPVVITKPYRYKMTLTQLSVDIDARGSRYECVCIPEVDRGYTNTIFKTPKALDTVGTTIEAHIADFERKINAWHSGGTEDNQKVYQVPDKFVFDLSELIVEQGAAQISGNESSQDSLSSGALYSDLETDAVNQIINSLDSFGKSIDRNQAVQETRKDASRSALDISAENLNGAIKLNVKEGVSFKQYLTALLSMSPEFASMVTRVDLDDAEAGLIRKEQAFVSWFKIEVKTKDLGFDPSRNTNAFEYTFIPVIYKTARTDVGVNYEENNNIDADQSASRIDQYKQNGSLLKAYDYYFTGLNDQIKSLDVRYDNGLPLILAPQGGAAGDISITAGVALSRAIPADEDVSFGGQINNLYNTVKESNQQKTFVNFLGLLRGANQTVKDRFVNEFSQFSGQTGPEDLQRLRAALDNQLSESESAAQSAALAQQISTGALDDFANSVEVNPTEPPGTTGNDDGTEYDPDGVFSGYSYSADILNPLDPLFITAEQVANLGYFTVEDLQDATEIKPAVVRTVDLPTENDGASYKRSSTKNKLLGFLANQHAAEMFLISLNMTVRGDPWYLGTPGLEKSVPEQANFRRDDNLFWLTIASASKYDPDWRDEDSPLNSGYWAHKGVSRSFSGIYRMLTVVNRFNQGEYTCEIKAHKLPNITVGSLVEPEPLDEVTDVEVNPNTFPDLDPNNFIT